jgi:4-hydroxybenzoyl-CoA thioesterase
MKFEVEFLIRFQHCDPAGIVFYPRYFEMVNSVVEDWFAEGLGVSIRDMNRERHEGIPMVHIECDFLKPSLIGDVLLFELAVERIGRSSFSIVVSAGLGREERLRARQTLVYVRLGPDRPVPIPIPDDIRAMMERYLTP